MRCAKLCIVATKCLAGCLEGGRIYLGCGFGSLVHHGGRKQRGERREEGQGGRGEGREGKGRGAEERRESQTKRDYASCLSITSSHSTWGPSLL